MNRRSFITAALSSALLPACSNSTAFKTINTAIEQSLGQSSAFDPAYPDQLPYASISVASKGQKKALLILGKVDGDELHWFSADRSVIVTRFGRIVRTAGLPENLRQTQFSTPDYFEPTFASERPQNALRIVDLSPYNRYGIKVESTLSTGKQETIVIGKRNIQTTIITEQFNAPEIGWKSNNYFWVDTSGIIWRSIQQLGPSTSEMTIEVTKPFSG